MVRHLYFSRSYQKITNPSLLTEYLIVKMHKLLYQELPQYRIDGYKNIWIVKPGYDARGHNIYCINDIKQVVTTGKKIQSAKIVQKYIETPFLIPRQITPSSSLLLNNNASTTTTASSTTAHKKQQQQPQKLLSGEKLKFDIRQWVLVTSFDPLVIYCYQSAYLRLCGSTFDLNDVQDLFKHLTNYTIQKGNSNVANVKQDLIMSTQAFEQYIRKQHAALQKSQIFSSYYKKFSWIKDIFPKISEIATRVLKSGAETIQNRSNCFQLYGFDFVIDDRLTPWLIQVNLSPACAERTQWLRNILQKMSDGLVATLEQDKLKQSDQGKTQQQQFIRKCGWQKTFDQRTMDRDWINLNSNSNNQTQNINCNQINLNDGVNQFQIQVVGEKLKGKQERYFKRRDMYEKMKDSPLKIQLAWRRYLARREKRNIIQRNNAIRIQKQARVWIAKIEARKRLQQRQAIKIQAMIRRKIAMNLLKMKMLEKADQNIWNATLKLQSIRRMVKAIQLRRQLKLKRCAIMIQSLVRRKNAKAVFQKRKYYIQKLREIQRFYHKRYQLKISCSIKIQRWSRKMALKIKSRKIGQCSKLIYKITKVKNYRSKINSFRKFKLNSSAIFLQCLLRRALALKQCNKLSYNRAVKNFKFITRKLLIRFTKYFAHRVKTLRYKLATKLQKYAKSFLKRRKFIQYLRKRRKNRSAITIQSLYRGHKSRRYAKQLKIQKQQQEAQRLKKLKHEKKQHLQKKQSSTKLVKRKVSNSQVTKADNQIKDQNSLKHKKKNMKKVVDCMVDRLYQSTNINQTPAIQTTIKLQKQQQKYQQFGGVMQLADIVQLSNRFSQMGNGVSISQSGPKQIQPLVKSNSNQYQQSTDYYQNKKKNQKTSSTVFYQSNSRVQNIYKNKAGGINRKVRTSSSIGKAHELKTLQNDIYNEKIIKNQMNQMIKRQNQIIQKKEQFSQIQLQQNLKRKQENVKGNIQLPQVRKVPMKVKDQAPHTILSPQQVRVKRDFIAQSIKGIKRSQNKLQLQGEFNKKEKAKNNNEQLKRQPKMPNMSTKQGKKSVTKRPYNHNYIFQQQGSSPSINSKRSVSPAKRQSQSSFQKIPRHINQNISNRAMQNKAMDQKKIHMTYNKQQIQKFYSKCKEETSKQNLKLHSGPIKPNAMSKSQYQNCFIDSQIQEIRTPAILSPQAQQYGIVGGFSTFNNSSSNHNTLYNSNSQKSLESSERFYLVKSSSKGIICMDRPTLKNSKAGRKSSSSIGKSSKVTPVPTPPTFSHPFDSSSNMVGMSEKISNVIHHAQMKYREKIYSQQLKKNQRERPLSKCLSQQRLIQDRGIQTINDDF